MAAPQKYDWTGTVLPAGVAFVRSMRAGGIVATLRQLFYFLVSKGLIENSIPDYKSLSDWTTKARDAGKFPDLMDNGRSIRRASFYDDSDDVATTVEVLLRTARIDRSKHQPKNIYLGVEKNGLAAQLYLWFRDRTLPILPLGGWSSQTFRESVRRRLAKDERPSLLIYAGDFDPSGCYIGDQFAGAAGFDEVIRVGLNVEQLAGLSNNPYPPSKMGNSLIARFQRDYGPDLVALGYEDLVQFELDALPPPELRRIFQDAVEANSDTSAHQQALDEEAEMRKELEGRWDA